MESRAGIARSGTDRHAHGISRRHCMLRHRPLRYTKDVRYLITSAVLDVATAVREVSSSGAGAVNVFIGTVRDNNDGRRVLYLEYEAYEPLALKTLQQIGDEA